MKHFSAYFISQNNATMSATDIDLNAATEQVNNFTDIKLVYKNIRKFDCSTMFTCKRILLHKMIGYFDSVYYDEDITTTVKLNKLKQYLILFIVINNSTEIFCFIIIKQILIYLYNSDNIYVNNLIFIKSFNGRNNSGLFYTFGSLDNTNCYNLFMELFPIIEAKKMLKTQIHQYIHKKKQQPMHNKFFELILHPDNMQWMIDNKLVENNFANANAQ